jgi:hypothetical protein
VKRETFLASLKNKRAKSYGRHNIQPNDTQHNIIQH